MHAVTGLRPDNRDAGCQWLQARDVDKHATRDVPLTPRGSVRIITVATPPRKKNFAGPSFASSLLESVSLGCGRDASVRPQWKRCVNMSGPIVRISRVRPVHGKDTDESLVNF